MIGEFNIVSETESHLVTVNVGSSYTADPYADGFANTTILANPEVIEDESFITDIATTQAILNDIIVTVPSGAQTNISIHMYPGTGGYLGYALNGTADVYINTLQRLTEWRLNDQLTGSWLPVIVHEALHILGLAGIVTTSPYNRSGTFTLDIDGESVTYTVPSPYHVWTGPAGVAAYRQVIERMGGDTMGIMMIPMEDEGGAGTAKVHLEERDDIIINGVTHPAVTNEVMTGYLGPDTYITRITLGLLEDIGYTVRYDSPWIHPGVPSS